MMMTSKATKRDQILGYLRDPLTSPNSNASIARHFGVSSAMVAKLRDRVELEGPAFTRGVTREIPLDQIRLDGGTQPRAGIDEATVREYRDEMKAGKVFPPIGVVYDGTHYWPFDGFHRVHGKIKAGGRTILAEVKQGTQRDAILLSLGANAAHGLKRTPEDKRRAVFRALDDLEWRQWSDREIARHCSVGHPFIAKCRIEHREENPHLYLESIPDSNHRLAQRNGTTYPIKTGNIGKSSIPEPEDESNEEPALSLNVESDDDTTTEPTSSAMTDELSLADEFYPEHEPPDEVDDPESPDDSKPDPVVSETGEPETEPDEESEMPPDGRTYDGLLITIPGDIDGAAISLVDHFGIDDSRRLITKLRDLTSDEAGSAPVRLGQLHWRIEAAVGDGATLDEIEAATGISPNTIRPRMQELRRARRVMDSGAKRPTRTGSPATVWVRRTEAER